MNRLKEIAGIPEDWITELDEPIAEAAKLVGQGDPAEAAAALLKAAGMAESVGGKLDAWYAFAPGWLRTSAGNLAELKGFSYGLAGLGIFADIGTIISPQDSGTLGNADRGIAGLNAALLTADMVVADLPVVGQVAIAATGLYLAGDFLYHHWTPFHNVANDVGHATVKVADDVGHAAASTWHSVTSTIGSWF